MTYERIHHGSGVNTAWHRFLNICTERLITRLLAQGCCQQWSSPSDTFALRIPTGPLASRACPSRRWMQLVSQGVGLMLFMPQYMLDLCFIEHWCSRGNFKITCYCARRDLKGHLVQPSLEDISQADVIILNYVYCKDTASESHHFSSSSK